MTLHDATQRFLFEDTPIRGELTQLETTLNDVFSKHNYPDTIKSLLGQFMAAAAMLSDTIKFEGTLSLQVRGAGQVRTIMAECRDNSAIRAIAQYNDDFDEQGELLGHGQMAITIEPKKGQRYQGVVPINDSELSLAAVLEDYFQQSEQIRTRIWLFSNQYQSAGLMIQAMPSSASESSLSSDADLETWERVIHLASTTSEEEILSLEPDVMLNRLFHEETVRVFEPRSLKFECTCSKEKTANAVRTLGEDEALDIVREMGHIDLDCQFCREKYAFSAEDVVELFKEPGDSTLN
ncbi:Hsp33 family molecular chaperone HslO [Reinekea forsetii]|nr:Hsp33 family molecular chaperone HslO [Reinekea forsetii]